MVRHDHLVALLLEAGHPRLHLATVRGVPRTKAQKDVTPTPVVIRMPADLYQAVKAKAAGEERTMAQAIRYTLRQYVGA